ncbi:glycosyltransferase family 2 protein [Arthrobacter agilis]|uniref:glycosyltransferase family 2 protein n=1 Tax=Arthrobacter agilis TaxID=37921 RepID=UPI00278ACF0D|nr:glycosyltransferase family 2 protein [Arthrobacter agilis]MDQ0734082.1 glycosyltransferase involved in cell wall biosynthesis [Arthrobacter agilis]
MSGPLAAQVAVIMRTKDRPVLLKRAVDDVLRQNLQDWHLVIVNDGGAPDPVDSLIAANSGRFRDRVTILHHHESRGMEAASNAGIAASASSYVAIHDDDDSWHPDFLARTVSYLETSPDAGVGVRTEIVHERIEDDRVIETGRAPFSPEIRELMLSDALRYNRCVPIGLLYRRKLHTEVGGYDETLGAVGDWEFQLRVLQHHTLGFIDGEPLAFWHHRHDAQGPSGNSFLAGKNDHLYFDKYVRERHLHEYAAAHGLGALLYLAGAGKEQTDQLHHRLNYSDELLRDLQSRSDRIEESLRHLEAAVSDASLVSLLRRRYRRLKDRVRERRGDDPR